MGICCPRCNYTNGATMGFRQVSFETAQNIFKDPFGPVKQQLTLRLDADVIAWLKKQGTGYQTRLNALLREAMLKDVKKSA